MVKLVAGSNTEAEYAYDGAHRRTVIKNYTSGTLSETRHCYYTASWQGIEDRLGTSTSAELQFVWGLRYIDDLVLRDRDTDANGSLDERLYCLQDANWNPVAIGVWLSSSFGHLSQVNIGVLYFCGAAIKNCKPQ